jgi:hypothetical protein
VERSVPIPASLEVVCGDEFCHCGPSNEVTFEPDNRILTILGVDQCKSLYHIELPSSMNIFPESGLLKSPSRHVMLFPAETLVGKGLGNLRCAVVERGEDDHLKQNL